MACIKGRGGGGAGSVPPAFPFLLEGSSERTFRCYVFVESVVTSTRPGFLLKTPKFLLQSPMYAAAASACSYFSSPPSTGQEQLHFMTDRPCHP